MSNTSLLDRLNDKIQPFAEKIGADGYSANAVEAVKLVDRLLAE